MINEKLKDNKIEETFAEYLGITVTKLNLLLDRVQMTLGDYVDLAMALDNNNSDIDTKRIDALLLGNPKYAAVFGKFLAQTEPKTKIAEKEEKMKKRNPYAVHAKNRKADAHGGDKKQQTKKERKQTKKELKDLSELTESELTRVLVEMTKQERDLYEAVLQLTIHQLKTLVASERGFQTPGIFESKMTKRELQGFVFKIFEDLTPADIQKRTRDLEQASKKVKTKVNIDVDGKSADGELTGIADDPQNPNQKIAIVKKKQGGETTITDIKNVSLSENVATARLLKLAGLE